MSQFVLRHNETGHYVAPPGQPKSYTSKLEHARKYDSREAAKADACGNEHVVAVEDLL